MKNKVPTFPTLSKTDIANRLKLNHAEMVHNPFPQGFFQEPPNPAAILVPFTCIEGKWHLLFIRRTQNENDRHGGQVAFPGGRMDPEDLSLEATALREAHEEVGLKPSDIEILGKLHEFHTVTNYKVTPIVGYFTSPYPLKIHPDEVSRAFTIPLTWLAKPTNHQTIFRYFPQNRSWPIVYFDPYDGEALWGFTAQVVIQLLTTLESHQESPKNATPHTEW